MRNGRVVNRLSRAVEYAPTLGTAHKRARCTEIPIYYLCADIATPRYWSYDPSARRNHGTTLSRKPM